jgi:hypothetical protein
MDSPASSEPELLPEDNSESSEEYEGSDLVDEESDEDDSNVYVEYGWGGRTVRRVLQLDCPRLPVPQLPMHNALAVSINSDTRPWPSNEPCFLVRSLWQQQRRGGAMASGSIPPAQQLQVTSRVAAIFGACDVALNLHMLCLATQACHPTPAHAPSTVAHYIVYHGPTTSTQGPWAGLQDATRLYSKLETPTNTRPPPKHAAAATAAAAGGSAAGGTATRRNPIRAASAAIRALQGPSSSDAAPAGAEAEDGSSNGAAGRAAATPDRSVSPSGTRRRRRSAAGDEGEAEGHCQGSPLQHAASSGRPQGYGLVTALRAAAGSLFRTDSSSSGRGSGAGAAGSEDKGAEGPGNSSGKAAAAAAAAAASCSGHLLASTSGLLLGREMGAGAGTGFAPWQRRHLCCYRAFPNRYHLVRDPSAADLLLSAVGPFVICCYCFCCLLLSFYRLLLSLLSFAVVTFVWRCHLCSFLLFIPFGVPLG